MWKLIIWFNNFDQTFYVFLYTQPPQPIKNNEIELKISPSKEIYAIGRKDKIKNENSSLSALREINEPYQKVRNNNDFFFVVFCRKICEIESYH